MEVGTNNPSLRKLIARGKERGFLTYAEIDEHMPDATPNAGQFETLVGRLADVGIEVLAQPPDPDLLPFQMESPERALAEEADVIGALDSELAQIDDPLRLYLRQLRRRPLLTREDEIALAKRIEEGNRERIEAVAVLPLTINEILRVVDGSDVDESPELADARIPKLRDELAKTLRTGRGMAGPKARRIRQQIIDELQGTEFVAAKLDQVCQRIRNLAGEQRACESRIARVCIKKAGISRETFRKRYARVQAKSDWATSLTAGSRAEAYVRVGCRDEIRRIQKTLRRTEAEAGVCASELKKIHQRMAIGEAKAKRAKSEMIESNLRLVVSVAKKYRGRGLPFLDLIQEGNIGLMKAVDRFDHRLGYKFSTYGTWWIRQTITGALATQGRTIRVPVHALETMYWVKRVLQQTTQDQDGKVSLEDVAQRANMSITKVQELLAMTQQPLSTELPLAHEEDLFLRDSIEDKNVREPHQSITEADLKKAVNETLGALNPKEARTLAMRYGIGTNTRHTLQQIGNCFNVSRERIRQIEEKALEKLRDPHYSDHLRRFIED